MSNVPLSATTYPLSHSHPNNNNSLGAKLQRQGYLACDDAIQDVSALQSLRRQLATWQLRMSKAAGVDLATMMRVANRWTIHSRLDDASPPLSCTWSGLGDEALVVRDRVVALANSVLTRDSDDGEDTLELRKTSVLFKGPGACDAIPWHQDEPYSYSYDLTVWVPLDDVGVEDGCLEYAVGSHSDGLYAPVDFWNPEFVDLHHDDDIVAVPVKCGGALMHLPRTWHRSRPSTGERERMALAFRLSFSRRSATPQSDRPRVNESVPYGMFTCSDYFLAALQDFEQMSLSSDPAKQFDRQQDEDTKEDGDAQGSNKSKEERAWLRLRQSLASSANSATLQLVNDVVLLLRLRRTCGMEDSFGRVYRRVFDANIIQRKE